MHVNLFTTLELSGLQLSQVVALLKQTLLQRGTQNLFCCFTRKYLIKLDAVNYY